MIRAATLSFSYPGGPKVISELDVELAEGALLAILGPNGSGKSTLLKLLAGLLSPDSGSVSLEGRPLASFSRRELARAVSYVPQQATVGLPFTVGEIVLMGRHPYQSTFRFETDEDIAVVDRALELTETTEFASRPFHSLSGGEKQRVLIARAIAQDARLLLLDEPTAALDLKHEVRVWEILERLVVEQAKTVVGVTHHINLACLYCPRVLILKEGRAVASGAPRDLLERKLMESVYETPLRVETTSTSSVPFILPEKRSE
jgi:iron complex transport system ATP-binding protein